MRNIKKEEKESSDFGVYCNKISGISGKKGEYQEKGAFGVACEIEH